MPLKEKHITKWEALVRYADKKWADLIPEDRMTKIFYMTDRELEDIISDPDNYLLCIDEDYDTSE